MVFYNFSDNSSKWTEELELKYIVGRLLNVISGLIIYHRSNTTSLVIELGNIAKEGANICSIQIFYRGYTGCLPPIQNHI